MLNPVRRAAGRRTPVLEAADTHESRTRDRVLRTISEHGPITTAVLADDLGLTPTAVRRHLDNLAHDGLVEVREAVGPRGRGRPAKSYVVSEGGHRALTSDYDHLAAQALRFVAETVGADAVTAFAERRSSDLEDRYADTVGAAGNDTQARVVALTEALNRDGFCASVRPVGHTGDASPLIGIQLCQGHCPVHEVAAEFPQLCDAETEAFSRLVGVHVQRLATLAHGDHVCTTFVPLGSTTTPGTTTSGTTTPRTTTAPATEGSPR